MKKFRHSRETMPLRNDVFKNCERKINIELQEVVACVLKPYFLKDFKHLLRARKKV